MITIVLQCHNFQRRLCWMLSSLLKQTERRFAVDVAFFDGNGRPSTSQVIGLFLGLGLPIIPRRYTDFGRFERRGLVRNDQLRDCRSEWVWFADTDHVYHPDFVARLYEALDQQNGSAKILSAGRMSTPVGETNRLVNRAVSDEPCFIEYAFTQADRLEPKKRMRSCGAGHTQIARTATIPDGLYVDETECRDWSWTDRHQKARSDIQFRRRCGGHVSLDHWFTLNQIHLNHDRDNQAGRHLETQR